MIARCRVWLCALALLASAFPAWVQAAADVTGLQLVSSVRVGRTSFDYTYRINVLNGSPQLSSAQATVSSTAAATLVLKSTVALGNLAAGAAVTSTDTFTIRHDRTVAFNPASLVWVVSGTSVGTPTLSIAVSDRVVAPDGSISVIPTVRDGNGVVMSPAGMQFNLAVAPVGTVFGNSPVVTGLSVKFPKLSKRLLSPNPIIDPAGEFADTDPTDPQYGKETGGTFRVTVSLAGSSLSSSQDVVVLPAGSAQMTVKTNQYANQLGKALALAAQASQNGDAALLAQARSALQAVDANSDFTARVLSATSATVPPDGGLITPAMLTARGFTAGAQDAAFTAAITDLLARLRQARAQVDATNTAALTQAAVDALQSTASAYKLSLQTLKGLKTSTLGTAQQQTIINQLLATELPMLLDSIKRKSGQMLGVTITAAADAAPQLALTPSNSQPAWALEAGQRWLPLAKVAPVDSTAAAPAYRPAALSPQAMYADTRPVQFSTFFFTTFAAFTDLSGSALGNIIELSITLVNFLVNIELANVVNQNDPAGVALDYCLASSSFAFVCPNYTPTRIGGSGFGRDASKISVVLIGCVNAKEIRDLVTLKAPKDLSAGIRFIGKLKSLAESLTRGGNVAAIVTPDFIAEDDLGLGSDMLYFANGWPRVNQGRLFCLGVVIVMNSQTGGVAAVNINFLPQCG